MINKPIYFEQLNGIRFVAVLFVLMDHWLIPINPFSFFGHLGVVIFFVLSGFLITRILFESADSCRSNSSSPFVKLIRFIYRRSLRIFPIYYLLLLAGFILSISKFHELTFWLITYTPNIYIILNNTWIGAWDHLWTLAVEEQYYLFFPAIILFTNPKKYLLILVIMILVGVIFRLNFYLFNVHEYKERFWFVAHVNTVSALDSFGIGGLLAFLFRYKNDFFSKCIIRKSYFFVSIIFYFSTIIFSKYSQYDHDNIWAIVFERFFAGLLSFFLIAFAVNNKTWLIGRFFLLPWVSYLGQISYGIYLYHNVVYNYYHVDGNTIIGYLAKFFPNLSSEMPNFILLKFGLSILIVISLASLSWFFIEKPINRFKNRI